MRPRARGAPKELRFRRGRTDPVCQPQPRTMEAKTEDKLAPEAQVKVRAVFREFLRTRNLRQTPERFAILDEVYATDEHFDADELYIRLKAKGIRVSRATVYNTLDLLVACDLVGRHQFGHNQAKYERAYSYWQHDHLICIDCGKIMEFCDPRLQSIQETIAEIFDFDVKRHTLQLYGNCNDANCPGKKRHS